LPKDYHRMKMISFKRLFVGVTAAAAVFSVAAASGARAQQGPMTGGGQMTPQQRNQAMYKELKLSPAQITKMEALQKKYTGLVMTRMSGLQKKIRPEPVPGPAAKGDG
jgi:Spy/CpxP family protein refolding chaperone